MCVRLAKTVANTYGLKKKVVGYKYATMHQRGYDMREKKIYKIMVYLRITYEILAPKLFLSTFILEAKIKRCSLLRQIQLAMVSQSILYYPMVIENTLRTQH